MLLFCFGRVLRQRLKVEMMILFLCTEDDLSYRPLSYAQAFRRRGIPVVCVEKGILGTLRPYGAECTIDYAPHLGGPEGSVRIQTGTNRC